MESLTDIIIFEGHINFMYDIRSIQQEIKYIVMHQLYLIF